jgi:hypothetical protein
MVRVPECRGSDFGKMMGGLNDMAQDFDVGDALGGKLAA